MSDQLQLQAQHHRDRPIAVTQSAKGRKSGKKCVKQTTKNTKAKPCSLTVTLTTLTVKGRSGANKLAYGGAIGKHGKLKPGTYTAALTASDTAGKSKTATQIHGPQGIGPLTGWLDDT
jgi:hypothetical protein